MSALLKIWISKLPDLLEKLFGESFEVKKLGFGAKMSIFQRKVGVVSNDTFSAMCNSYKGK